MKNSQFIGQFFAFMALACFSCMSSNENTRPVPRAGVDESSAYQVSVNDMKVFTAHEPCYGDTIFATAICEIDGKSTIRINFKEQISSYSIKPKSKAIAGWLEHNTLTFEIDKPQMLLVEINHEKPLLLALLPLEHHQPDPESADVMWFGPGIHEPGPIYPTDGQTIYLAPGALVKGRIYGDGVKNVKVTGRGILDARGYTSKPDKICAIEFKNSDHIAIEGIGLRAGAWWQTLFVKCNDVSVGWMHLLSFGLNNDGIDIDGVTDFRAHDCFIGCGDDGFGWHAVNAEANGEPPTKNCLAENCVIYNVHAGNGLRVGASMETTLFRNIVFKNIDVLHHANAGIRSDHSDWALCEEIVFEHFYIEKPGRPIEIRIEKTRYSNDTGYRDERGHINGLYFKYVTANGGEVVLEGYDDNHLIENVHFIQCLNDGIPLDDISKIKVNNFVKNVVFE
ncbi:MAG: hypothetical protein HC819_09450 [Cyclobacteriaceae bacterium]|nr:hypothetical protein [Cyclobacteriaceae bacterium]